jgi:hypothetical protein
MERHDCLEVRLRIDRKTLWAGALVVALGAALFLWPDRAQAQKAQENYKEKFKIAAETGGGMGIATSADGKYVYVVGQSGILVSNDFGKTGTWTETVQLK